MKKINYIALASLVATITAVSCSKEEMQSSSISEGTVLTASITQAPDTKTAMSGAVEGSANVSIVWSENDKLSVLSGASYGTNNEFTLSTGAGAASGSFTGDEISGDIIAVYPYSSDVAYSTSKVTLNIPQTQVYIDTTFAQNSVPMVAKGTVGTNLDFNYLFSAIAFKVSGSGKNVTKVTVIATTPLWGPAEISNLDSTPSITMTGTDIKYRTVELTCATAQSITSDKVFYIAVPAGIYTFAVNVYCSDNTIFHQNYTTAKTFTIGKIKYNSVAKSFSDNGLAYVEGSYIGEGKKIGSTLWAPVNCGYDATSYPYGKLYQWGRKDGCGYNDGSTYKETLIQALYTENIQVDGSTVTEDADYFYWGSSLPRYDWLATQDDTRWNSGNESSPSKTSNDPCPTGWRVPTLDELGALCYTDWDSSSQSGSTKRGSWNSTAKGWDFDDVFLPAAGFRSYSNGNAYSRGSYGDYWSSSVNDLKARYLSFSSTGASMSSGIRASGDSVRCVQE